MIYDAIIIGGGAAGLFCASVAGQRGRRVLVIEHNSQPGRKILISGGGRCNFTNLGTTAENFTSENKHFAKSALAGYSPQDFVRLVRSHRIEFFEKKLGQLFCTDSARMIVEMLLAECGRGRVDLRTACSVKSVRRTASGFEVDTSRGHFESRKLVIACGGLSFPKVGATDFGYRVARQFGMTMVPTRPALVGLSFTGESDFKSLAGISVDAIASIRKRSFRENVLFTHHGLSGPAILQISNYWTPDESVSINLVPDRDPAGLIDLSSSQLATNQIAEVLPKRVVESIFSDFRQPASSLSASRLKILSERLTDWRLRFDRTDGYHRAEVTAGGVSTSEISSQTMESKKVAGLFFIGEVVDVTGWLGGYNFQWAWSSGFACANAI